MKNFETETTLEELEYFKGMREKTRASQSETRALWSAELKGLAGSPKPGQETDPPEEKRVCFIPWTLVKQWKKTLEVSPIKCKSWECLRCGPKKCKQLQHVARKGRPNRMITLTASSTSGDTFDERARSLSTAWRTVRRSARRRFKTGKIEFLAVFEAQESGNPHLHILCRTQYIPQAWLSKKMDNLIGAPIVWVNRIRNKRQAANYVTKYISKEPYRFKGCKRFWKSLAFANTLKKPAQEGENSPKNFYVVRSTHEKVIPTLVKKGFTMERETLPQTLTWWKDRPPPIRPGSTLEHWF